MNDSFIVVLTNNETLETTFVVGWEAAETDIELIKLAQLAAADGIMRMGSGNVSICIKLSAA